jgi:predicted flap endonuclease-1-like 5' DNA nuclease
MNGILWLMMEMLPLLLVTAVVAAWCGWRWGVRKLGDQRAAFDLKLDAVEKELAGVLAQSGGRSSDVEKEAEVLRLRRELEDAVARMNQLGAELLRLRDENLELKARPQGETMVPASSVAEGDDLTRIKGIGKVLARKLADHGVRCVGDLAAMDDEAVERLERVLGWKGRIQRERWREQAMKMG